MEESNLISMANISFIFSRFNYEIKRYDKMLYFPTEIPHYTYNKQFTKSNYTTDPVHVN